MRLLADDQMTFRLVFLKTLVVFSSGVRIKQRKGQARATAKFEPEGELSYLISVYTRYIHVISC
jgi:hypothetical protein